MGAVRLLRQPLALVLGLRLHLVGTLHGLPVCFALAGAKAVDRGVLLGILAAEPQLVAARPGQVLTADKNYYGREFEHVLAKEGLRLLRPARTGEPERAGARLFKPPRQLIEMCQRHLQGSAEPRTARRAHPVGVAVRILQRILALTAAIWHTPHRPADPAVPDRL